MKANELRIGNYVTWRDEESKDSILTVTGIVLNDCIWVEWEWEDGEKDYTECDFDGLKPIPITEEFLIKFGFEKCDKYNMAYTWRHKDVFFELRVEEDFESIRFENLPSIFSEIKYIHQLQNLYFALTGEELTIKE
jgi:hypothetical protein